MATTLRCRQCAQQVFPEDRFCAICGAEVESPVSVPAEGTLTRALFISRQPGQLDTCLSCSTSLLPTDQFCATCGTAKPASLSTPGIAATPPAPAPEGADMWQEVVRRLRAATLGEYEIAGKLGSGGMAAVFLAHEIALNRKVAIKVMAPTFLVDSGLVDRFRQEARTVAAMRHPNIVNIHAVREMDHLHFFVMQFIAGRSLSEVVKEDGPLPIPLITAILFQVGSALAYAHRRGVIHRDIKPANIMLDDEGNAIVTDFGIAKVAESPQYTMTGGTIGTPAYMSPEQCNAGSITGASDQYSLGVVAYELLTGSPPFVGPHYAVMGAHVAELAESVERRRPDCPPALAEAVMRMLAKTPAERFGSTSEAAITAGGAPLGDHDPIRQLLAQRSTRSIARTVELQASTPASPLPRQLSTPTGQRVATIQISQLDEELPVGMAIRLGVRLTSANGAEVTTIPVTWQSDNPAVASVSHDGTVTGYAPGVATVSASCQGQSATSLIRVAGPQVTILSVAPTSVRLAVGASLKLAATTLGADGAPLSAEILWQSSDPAIVTVTGNGRLTGVAVGSAKIGARAANQKAIVPVEIIVREKTAPGGWNKGWLAGAGVAAMLLAGLVVFDPFGWLYGPKPSPEKPSPTLPVAAEISVSPIPDTMRVAASDTLIAEVRDSAGKAMADVSVQWSSSASQVLTATGQGNRIVLHAVAPGTATIIVSAGSVSRSLPIVVIAQPAPDFAIILPRREVAVGESMQLSLPRGDGQTSWHSSRPEIATVSPEGLVRGVAPGSAEIVATRGTETARARVSVREAATRELTVSPARLELRVGEIGRLRVGSGTASQARFSFKVSEPSLVWVVNAGPGELTATALSPGDAQLTVTAGSARTVVPIHITDNVVPLSLELVPAQAAFELTLGGGPPPAQRVTATRVGGTVNDRIAILETEYAPASAAWLAATLQGSLITLQLTDQAGTLAPGPYSARVSVTAGRQRRALTVSLTVAPAAGGTPVSKSDIQQLLDDYAAAINAGDSTKIRRAYPTIGKRGLQDLLEIGKNRGSAAYDIRIRGELREGSEPGTVQGAVVALFLGGRRAGGITNIYTFKQQDGRWVIESWRPLR